MKRSMDWCNLNIMGCALYFTHIIPFRLHFDVIRFLDTHVTGRQDYIEDREIEGDLLTITKLKFKDILLLHKSLDNLWSLLIKRPGLNFPKKSLLNDLGYFKI